MRALRLLFVGDISFLDELISEVENLGHMITHSSGEVNYTNYDYVLFFDKNDFSNLTKKCQHEANKAVICVDHRVILFKNADEAYELYSSSTDQNLDVDVLIDTIILLSTDDLSTVKVIPMTIASVMEITDTPTPSLSPEEYQKIVYDWNNTAKDYPSDKTIHQLFEEQVQRTPDNIAVIYEDTKLTYQELNQRSNQLAHYLLDTYQIQGDDLIALCLDRSEHMLIAILGVLKSGAAYVPMDPSYPDERISYILADTQTKIILINEVYEAKLTDLVVTANLSVRKTNANPNSRILVLDKREVEQLSIQPVNNPMLNITSTNLAYIIYTSGTTGIPKGVMVEHSGVINRIEWMSHNYPITERDKILQKATYVFDASVWELFWANWYGGSVVFAKPDGHKDPSYLIELMNRENITVSYFVPSMLGIFEDVLENEIKDGIVKSLNPIPSLRYVFCGGEPLHLYQVNKFHELLPFTNLYNVYGPTEASIDVLSFDCNHSDISHVYIGKPIDNIQAYILDDKMCLLPIGAIGELYIGGVGLARGYLNKPELTAEKFIANPFQTEMDKKQSRNARLYKTGDLVRYLPDGNIEYIGRNDFQVKIRGFRIELGEIESNLAIYAGISWVAVLTKNTGNDVQLVAFYRSQYDIPAINLRNHLLQALPDYMVPFQYIKIDMIPLTINGKLDRDLLLDLANNSDAAACEFSYQNEYEEFVGDLWLSILPKGIKKLDTNSNFFELGGNSLLVAKLILEVRKQYKINIKPKDIFEYLTLGDFAKFIGLSCNDVSDQNSGSGLVKIRPDAFATYEAFPLTEVQEAYLMGRSDYMVLGKISTHIYMEMMFEDLDLPKLEYAWNQVIKRHNALRTIIKEDYQQVLPDVEVYKIECIDINNARNLLSHQVFNPEEYPLFNVKVSQDIDGYQIHFGFDAIITDVYSLSNIFIDLHTFYNGENLAGLEINFRDCVLYSLEQQETEAYRISKEYWSHKISSMPEMPKLPFIKEIEDLETIKFKRHHTVLSSKVWHDLKVKVKHHAISPTTVFLLLYGYILSRFGENKDVLLNLTLFNRDIDHPQINSVVGDFTTLELFSYIDNSHKLSIVGLLKQCQESLWEDLEHKLYGGVSVTRDIRKYYNYNLDKLIAPYVFTSALGHRFIADDFLNDTFSGISYESAQTSQCLLDNIIREDNDSVRIDWYYVDGIFDEEFLEHLFKSYIYLIEELAKIDWVSSLPILKLPNKHQLLIDQANSAVQPLTNDTLFELFANSVQSYKDKVAVVDGFGQYTYRQLYEYSTKIACYLHNQHADSKSLIAVFSEKGYIHVAAVLGVLQFGAAYLPLPVNTPIKRIDEILTEGMVKLVLISRTQYHHHVSHSKVAHSYTWIIIEDLINSTTGNVETIKPVYNPDAVAYVIFTSGSTGKPKGVTISHRGAINTILAVNDRYQVSVSDKIFALSELSFDLSVYDIFGMLAVGGTVIFPDYKKVRDPHHWVELITKHQITLWNTVPQLAGLLIDEVVTSTTLLESLRVFLLSGDWIPTNLPDRIKQQCSYAKVIGLGGATEGSIWSIWYDVTYVKNDWSKIPYGTAMPNQKMYVLNSSTEHCPIGVIGEIYIGGEGVALNYYEDQIKTKASFINHTVLGRLYKTGDLGKWNSEGYIDFMGRKDKQVKLNGYRVELSEIEDKISRISGVENVLVTVQDNQLISYIVYNAYTASTIANLIEKSCCSSLFCPLDYELFPSIKLEDKIIATSKRQKILRDLYEYALLSLVNELKIFTIPGSYYKISEIIKQTGILPRYQKWLSRALENLYSLGYIKKDNSLITIYFNEKILPKANDNVLKVLSEINDSGQLRWNVLNLKNILTTDLSAEIYLDSASDEQYKNFLGPEFIYIKNVLESITKQRTDSIKILEVGAGTGALADIILNVCTLEYDKYFFTDISRHFLAEIQEKYISDKLICQLYNLDEPPELQDVWSHRFDVIIANDVLHNVKDIRKTLSNITKILKPSGLLIFLDVAQFNMADDIKFGFFSGFENFEDYSLRPYQPCLTQQQWELILSEAGFTKQQIICSDDMGNINRHDLTIVGVFSYGTTSKWQLDTNLLIKSLKDKLPDYMVPQHYITLPDIPLTENGKINYKSLPKIHFTQYEYVPPISELENRCCAIYANLLGLDVKDIGVTDNFFKLGGNSIVAIKLVRRLNSELGLSLDVSAIFKYTSIESLLANIRHYEIIISRYDFNTVESQLLSFAQQRLWFIESYERGTNAYNIPLIYKLANGVDIMLLSQALKATVLRHEVLHSFVKTNSEGNGYQEVGDLTKQPLHIRVTAVADKKSLLNQVSNEVNDVFNLEQEYPIRVNIFKLKPELNISFTTADYDLNESDLDKPSPDESTLDRYLVIVIHHIAFDGWSIEVFLNDLNTYYKYNLGLNQDSNSVVVKQNSSELNLPELSIQYRDFAVWQRGYLSGEILGQQLSYWKDKLSDYENLNLITDKARPNQIDYSGDNVYFSLDAVTSTKLRELAKQLQVSLYSVLLSGFNLLLRSYANQDDIVIGTLVSNRHYEQLEHLVGFFVNSLALRSKIDSEVTLIDYIQSTGKEVIEAQLHQDLPFEKLVEELNVVQDASRHPIFQVMFGIQSFGYKEDDNILFSLDEAGNDNLLFELYSQYRVAKFDLTVMLDDSGVVISGSFNYATSLFKHETIKQYIATYKHILEQIAAHMMSVGIKQKKQLIKELSYLDSATYTKVIGAWNNTVMTYTDEGKILQHIFEEQVARTPNNTAVVYEDTKLTYQELNQRANQLAHYLRTTYKIQGDDLIALCLERSEYMLIAILGVLKSGAAYVPLDPGYPEDRFVYVFEDTKARVVLTNELYVARLTKLFSSPLLSTSVVIHALDNAEFQAMLAKQDSSNPVINITSSNLAYVIYTSGTTGKPKGVMIEHYSICNFIYSIPFNNDNYLNAVFTAPYIFDVSIFDIWSNLLHGHSIFIVAAELLQDVDEFDHFLAIHQINKLYLPAALVKLHINTLVSNKNIIQLLTGVETLESSYISLLSHINEVINGYGPTEATVCSTLYCVNRSTVQFGNIPLGRPISNVSIYVLDTNLNPLPIGAIGELYIGGAGLARGYLNNLELTAERFIANPFQTDEEKHQGKNARLYKTGDLVRYANDGNIEYLGRNDFQVKIRGFRIELGEIETVLNNYNGINQAVVLVCEHVDSQGNNTKNKYLVAYYVAGNKLDETDVLNSLTKHLPDYMVPSVLVYLEALPLTANGKLDRKALPDLEFTSTDNYVAPRNKSETDICIIFAELLGLDSSIISINDDFFRLGGNSILAIKLVSRLNSQVFIKINNKINIAMIFKNRTILALSKLYTENSSCSSIYDEGEI